MPFAFFTIPIRDTGAAQAELNGFLGSHKILKVARRFVDEGSNSFWSFCVDYLDAGTGINSRTTGLKGKTDYQEVLNPEEFEIFARLRELRKEISQAEAVPVYTVFNNEQLAAMARSRVKTQAELGKIDGVGEAKAEKYGPRFLELLTSLWGTGDEAGRKPV